MTTIIAFVIVLGILIFIHELGHFLFAKLNGVGVLKFSLGFGPALIKKKIGETEYMVSAVPLGGYVKMLGEDARQEDDGLSAIDPKRSFAKKSLKARSSIVVAGPLFNLLLAIVIFMIIGWIGLPFFPPVIGTVLKDSPADKSGLKSGDRIVSIQGGRVEAWEDIPALMSESKSKGTYEIIIDRDGTQFAVHVKPEIKKDKNIFGEDINRAMIGISKDPGVILSRISPNSPAQKAGLKPGDRIVSIDGKPTNSLNDIPDVIQSEGSKPALTIVIERNGSPLSVKLAPVKAKEPYVIGKAKVDVPVMGVSMDIPEPQRKSLGFVGGVAYGFTHSWDIVELTGIGVWKMIDGSVDVKKSLGGPILIAQISGQTFRKGMLDFFYMIAFVSINLFLINLLPIPVLDGGHIMLFAIEGVIGRPLKDKPREIAQQIGLFILVVIMLLALYNDIMRLVSGG
jgi:regulator of sigma E protease